MASETQPTIFFLSLPRQCYRSSAWALCSRWAQSGRWGLLLPPMMISPWEVQATRTFNLPWPHIAETILQTRVAKRMGLPWVVKNLPVNAGWWKRCRFDPWVGKISWGWKWQVAPVFLPGKSHGQRSLASYSPWGCRELDMIEWLSTCTWPRRPDFPFYHGKESAKYIFIYIKLSYTFETNTTL